MQEHGRQSAEGNPPNFPALSLCTAAKPDLLAYFHQSHNPVLDLGIPQTIKPEPGSSSPQVSIASGQGSKNLDPLQVALAHRNQSHARSPASFRSGECDIPTLRDQDILTLRLQEMWQ